MNSGNNVRIAFALGTAVTAAAVTDAVVEHLSNVGFFGAGSFTDHSNLDVVPTLLIGVALFALAVIGLARRMRSHFRYAPRWLRRSARMLDAPTLKRLIGPIYLTQMLVLYVMETIEQIVVYGHTLGPTVWFGAPAAAALALHALGCVLFTALLALLVRWSARTLAEAVFFVRHLFRTRRPPRLVHRIAVLDIPRAALPQAIPLRLEGRAPPYLLA